MESCLRIGETVIAGRGCAFEFGPESVDVEGIFLLFGADGLSKVLIFWFCDGQIDRPLPAHVVSASVDSFLEGFRHAFEEAVFGFEA